MEKNPLVSVIIITMNHEKFITQACESVIAQTYENIEIILLDNLSHDSTFENAKLTLEKSKFPIKIMQNSERFGIAKNLNILVSHTKGALVCILSGDDWLTENSIAEKVRFFQEEKVDFALSDGYKFLEDEQKLIDAYPEKKKKKIIESLPNFFKLNVTHNEPYNVGVIVKRELLVNHPFDENIHAEDWDMNLRLTHLGYKIGFIDQKLFNYRILTNSLSKNWNLMQISYDRITDKYLDFIKADPNLFKNYKINQLKHHFEILLSNATSDFERKEILKRWKKQKYRLKYSQPVLFFKLLFMK